MAEHAPSSDLAAAMRAGHRHACAFFRAPEEELAVLLPFITDGLERGEKVWHILDPERRSEVARRLERAGIDSAALERSGQLDVSPWEEAHLRGGRFDPGVMLGLVDGTFAGNRAQGYPRTRLWANMEWAVRDAPGVGDLAAYEARLNNVGERREDLTVCVYDLRRHGAAALADALRSHPLVSWTGGRSRTGTSRPPPSSCRSFAGAAARRRCPGRPSRSAPSRPIRGSAGSRAVSPPTSARSPAWSPPD
jgi:hypothetical protein